MKSYAVAANPWVRWCSALVMSGLVGMASAPVQADSLRVQEARSDKLKCKYDRDIEARTCAVATTGKYDVTLKVSSATLANSGVDLATLLQDAEADQLFSVSLGIGPYQFDGEVSEGSGFQLTASGVKSEWVTEAEKCLDIDCSNTKTVRAETVKFAGTPDGGVVFKIKGSSLSDDNNEYGDSLLADDCVENAKVAETISLVLNDGDPIELAATMTCRTRTNTKHKAEEDYPLTRVRLTAKLGESSSLE